MGLVEVSPRAGRSRAASPLRDGGGLWGRPERTAGAAIGARFGPATDWIYTRIHAQAKPNHVFVRCWLGHFVALPPIHVGLVTLTPSLPSPKPASHGPSSFIEMMPEVVCQQSMFPPRPLCLWRLGRGEWPI